MATTILSSRPILRQHQMGPIHFSLSLRSRQRNLCKACRRQILSSAICHPNLLALHSRLKSLRLSFRRRSSMPILCRPILRHRRSHKHNHNHNRKPGRLSSRTTPLTLHPTPILRSPSNNPRRSHKLSTHQRRVNMASSNTLLHNNSQRERTRTAFSHYTTLHQLRRCLPYQSRAQCSSPPTSLNTRLAPVLRLHF